MTGSQSLGSNKSPGGGLIGAKNRGGHHHGRGSSNTNRVLTALIFVAFAFSLATVFLSSPSIARSLAALEYDIAGANSRNNVRGGGGRTTATPPPTPPGPPEIPSRT